jgi:hypothetical protein
METAAQGTGGGAGTVFGGHSFFPDLSVLFAAGNHTLAIYYFQVGDERLAFA